MATPPFEVLEKLIVQTILENKDKLLGELTTIGKKLIEKSVADEDTRAQGKTEYARQPTLLDYAHKQCTKADRALQGNYSVDEILFLDALAIGSRQQVWEYRRHMAAMSGYDPKKHHVWIETEHHSEDLNARLMRESQQDVQEKTEEGERVLGYDVVVEGVMLKEAQPLSPLELCAALDFGYRAATELKDAIKRVVMADFVKSEHLLRRTKEAALARRDTNYAQYIAEDFFGEYPF